VGKDPLAFRVLAILLFANTFLGLSLDFAAQYLLPKASINLPPCEALAKEGVQYHAPAVVCWFAAALVCVGVPFLGVTAYFLTSRVKNGRRKLVIVASLLPIACVGWALSVLWVKGTIDQNFLNRDPGYGDVWACPLPDGYAMEMIDDPDVGVLYNTKTQTLRTGVAWGTGFEDTIGGVRTLQVAGPYIFGGVDSHADSQLDNNEVDSYFLLDTRTGTHSDFSTYDALHGAALELGFELKLEGIDAVYSKYRFTWFDVFMGLMLCVPPLLALGFLVRWIIRLRKTRGINPQQA
jgi:hypothetical protein